MTQHTPGPWRKSGTQVLAPSLRHAKSHLLVAQVYETAVMIDEPDHADADAALIAAAPDLLEAAKNAVYLYGTPKWDERQMNKLIEVVNAIAKAEAQS